MEKSRESTLIGDLQEKLVRLVFRFLDMPVAEIFKEYLKLRFLILRYFQPHQDPAEIAALGAIMEERNIPVRAH